MNSTHISLKYSLFKIIISALILLYSNFVFSAPGSDTSGESGCGAYRCDDVSGTDRRMRMPGEIVTKPNCPGYVQPSINSAYVPHPTNTNLACCRYCPCSTNSDCGSQQSCMLGRCYPKPCPSGTQYFSALGTCQIPVPCNGGTIDSNINRCNCPSERPHLNAGKCNQCLNNTHCGSGQLCNNGICNAGCTTNAQCPNDKFCDIQGLCKDDRLIPICLWCEPLPFSSPQIFP